jgi:hypothetical protein
MCLAIGNPAICEICVIIRFLHAENMRAPKIHRQLCVIYGKNVISVEL